MPAVVTQKHTGRLVVRVHRDVVDRIAHRAKASAGADLASLEALAADFGLHGLRETVRRYPGLPSYPTCSGTGTRKILDREARAREGPFPPIHSLTGYFVLDPRQSTHAPPSARLLAELNAMPEIEVAYPEVAVRAPNWAVNPGDPFVKDQGYLDVAPKGIGANTAEVWGAFDGAGIGFVDLESGWDLNHVDLPQAEVDRQPLINRNDRLLAEHGTGVLGIVLGKADGAGITGIAPGAKFMGVASWFDDKDDVDIPSAIHAAMDVLKPGDVLLLEVETATGYPIEVEDRAFIAIQTAASTHDIIVIEAAGNGTGTVGRNLDNALPHRPSGAAPRSLNRKSGAFLDSGAIMVSACRSSVTKQDCHRRLRYAGSGSRIDCYAWGDNVATAGGTGLGPSAGANRSYTNSFDRTSAAAAIIAGATILVQEMAERGGRPRLSPNQMRALLSGQVPGTDVLAPSGSQKIGVMPDLKAVASHFRRP
jgi:hypothetical protein